MTQRRLQTNRGENLTKHAVSIHAYVNKEEKIGRQYEEGGDKQKKQDP